MNLKILKIGILNIQRCKTILWINYNFKIFYNDYKNLDIAKKI